jgi:hypothetical protein
MDVLVESLMIAYARLTEFMKQRKCPSNKVIYMSHALAEDALIESWIRNNYALGTGPLNVYQCDDCGNFHFTSKGAMNERLKREWDNGSIARARRAFDLEAKLRRR